jgi:hypothetical protein
MTIVSNRGAEWLISARTQAHSYLHGLANIRQACCRTPHSARPVKPSGANGSPRVMSDHADEGIDMRFRKRSLFGIMPVILVKVG